MKKNKNRRMMAKNFGGVEAMQEVNEMPNLTAKPESYANISPAGTTIKRVQQLPIEENLLKFFGGIMNFQDRLPALMEKVEDWLNSQKEVIRFSNCPVLLPPAPEAHFIFEDAEKLSLREEYTYHNHSGECAQPELPVKGLKFDFMDFVDFTKIQKLLQKLYSRDYYTLYIKKGKYFAYIYKNSEGFCGFNGSDRYYALDLLICRIPSKQKRLTFILNKGLVPVITDIEVRKVYLLLQVLKEKALLTVANNQITVAWQKKSELAKVLQELGYWQEPKSKQELDKALNELSKNADAALVDDLQASLLACDKMRFDLTEYDKMLLEDPNRGSWELWDAVIKQERMLPTATRSFYARDPRRDIVDGGVVGIDFGTKSTVVMTQDDSDAIEPVRIGIGNVQAEPKIKDYENPTVMEFIDIASFEKAYQQSGGRPLTHWEDATSSHTAFDDWKNNKSSGNYFSFFAELKQWAGDPERRVRVRDTKGKEIDLPPYAELPENSFDPIELYAYYIGL